MSSPSPSPLRKKFCHDRSYETDGRFIVYNVGTQDDIVPRHVWQHPIYYQPERRMSRKDQWEMGMLTEQQKNSSTTPNTQKH